LPDAPAGPFGDSVPPVILADTTGLIAALAATAEVTPRRAITVRTRYRIEAPSLGSR
jgi:hypothetical protein